MERAGLAGNGRTSASGNSPLGSELGSIDSSRFAIGAATALDDIAKAGARRRPLTRYSPSCVTLSLSAIRAKSGSDDAFILRMT